MRAETCPGHTDVQPDRRARLARGDRRRLLRRVAAVMMGDIGEEIIEIELEPLPEEVPAEAPTEPVTEPASG